MKLKDLIKDNLVMFEYVTKDEATYSIEYNELCYFFKVPLSDIGTGVLKPKDKAIMFMRWIGKALEANELIINECCGYGGKGHRENCLKA